MPFTFTRLAIPDVVLVEARSFSDERGYFRESYKATDFAREGLPTSFLQDNLSRSSKGVLRGLHFQRHPYAQGKLVGAARGAVFDVAVDLRPGSSTYGEWVGETLTDENARLLWIPPGFAHGFCVLSDIADLAYKATAEYSGPHDAGVRWDDPAIGIRWPIVDPILSDKDRDLPLLADL